MNIKLVMVGLFSIIIPISVSASFFSNSEEFKCGRDDTVNALKSAIFDKASAILETEFITTPDVFYQPKENYRKVLKEIPIEIKNVSTTESKDIEVSCTADVSIKTPANAIDVVTIVPKFFETLVKYNYSFNIGNIIRSDYQYGVKLADNKKDLIVKIDSDIAETLATAAWLAVSKDNLIRDINKEKIDVAKLNYEKADAELNMIWKGLPDGIRMTLSSSQISWVKEKTVKCGKISDANHMDSSTDIRIKIFQCQEDMTTKRIYFLSNTSGELVN